MPSPVTPLRRSYRPRARRPRGSDDQARQLRRAHPTGPGACSDLRLPHRRLRSRPRIPTSPSRSPAATSSCASPPATHRPIRASCRFDCLPIRADAFALFDMDRPTRCSITDLRFAPNGTALAALGNDRMLRVFRIGGEQARSGERAAGLGRARRRGELFRLRRQWRP